jgi:two-component system, chemotaxis family, chemotaxis protein CheY
MPMGYEMGGNLANAQTVKVLVVDDSASSRALVRLALLPHGFEVIEASNGAAALSLLDGGSPIAAVVCDLNMPVMNGLMFLERLRAHAVGAALPVLMLSIVADSLDMKLARSFGIMGWLTKPLDPGLLVDALTKSLGQGGNRGE